MTGATGFVGNWILQALLYAREYKNFPVEIHVVGRNPEKFNSLYSQLKLEKDSVRYISANLGTGEYSNRSNKVEYELIVYGATPASTLELDTPLIALETAAVRGLDEVIKTSSKNDGSTTLINLSSGAVYGNSARSHKYISESAEPVSTFELETAYCEAKIKSEQLVRDYTNQGIIKGSNPRLFAFAGPGIPINEKFAVGSFVNSARLGKLIQIVGSPDTTRSYMYPSDLVIEILMLSLRPTLSTIHIGSSAPMNMKMIAMKVNEIFEGIGVEVIQESIEPNHYVPITANTENYLKFHPNVCFETGLLRWKSWLRDSV